MNMTGRLLCAHHNCCLCLLDPWLTTFLSPFQLGGPGLKAANLWGSTGSLIPFSGLNMDIQHELGSHVVKAETRSLDDCEEQRTVS